MLDILVLVLVAGSFVEDTYCTGTGIGTGCRYACLTSLKIHIVLVLVLVLAAANFALKSHGLLVLVLVAGTCLVDIIEDTCFAGTGIGTGCR